VLDETALLDRALRGEPSAFDELVRGFYAPVYATAFHLIGNHEDAEDLAQDCFVRAHRGLAHYRGEGSFMGWLRRILLHLVRDRIRQTQRRPVRIPLMEKEVVARNSPVQELSTREVGRRVAEAIEALPENLRISLLLRTQEGLSYEELASATGVTPQTARTRVMKARKGLRRSLAYLLDLEAGGQDGQGSREKGAP
jgi:RNA polymerase sigma-70 factor (ECF subfamily)